MVITMRCRALSTRSQTRNSRTSEGEEGDLVTVVHSYALQHLQLQLVYSKRSLRPFTNPHDMFLDS